MATILNADAVAKLALAPVRKGRPESAYAAYVALVCDRGDAVGGCEADFSEVKPAHVIHMFRKVLKADASLAALVASVGYDKSEGGAGVYLIPA